MRHFQYDFLECNCFKFDYNLVDFGPTDSSPLVYEMVCHRPGNKPLPELIVTQFTAAYIRRQAFVS